MRPGIAVVMPSSRGPVVLLDAGANAEARPEHYPQFALMGRLFARDVLGLADPRVGLLSIGEEAARGSENLMPPLLEAVRAYATLGEMVEALRDVFGGYEEAAKI